MVIWIDAPQQYKKRNELVLKMNELSRIVGSSNYINTNVGCNLHIHPKT